MERFLTDAEESILREAHRAERVKKQADRIKAILWLNAGWSYEQIAQALFLDHTSVRRYEKIFRAEGLDELLKDHYCGGTSKLSKEEETALKAELKHKIYLSSKEICEYIDVEFKAQYTPEGLIPLLNRLGFVYKKTKHVPGKANAKA